MRGRADAIGQKARRTQIHTRDRVRDAVRPRVTVQGRLGLQTEQHRHAGGLRRLDHRRVRVRHDDDLATSGRDLRHVLHGALEAELPLEQLHLRSARW